MSTNPTAITSAWKNPPNQGLSGNSLKALPNRSSAIAEDSTKS